MPIDECSEISDIEKVNAHLHIIYIYINGIIYLLMFVGKV